MTNSTPFPLQIDIDTKLKNDQESRKDRVRSGKFNPSLLGYCYRRQVWNKRNEPQTNPPDERALRVFKAGELFEEFIFSLLPNLERQVLVEDEYFKGYADGVRENEVIECKSQHSKAFWYMDKSDIQTDKIHNILQAFFYAYALRKQGIRLIYVSKDDLCIREYPLLCGPVWEHKLNNEKQVLIMYFNNTELPAARPRLFNGKECGYCPFLDKCLGLEGENHPTKVKKDDK